MTTKKRLACVVGRMTKLEWSCFYPQFGSNTLCLSLSLRVKYILSYSAEKPYHFFSAKRCAQVLDISHSYIPSFLCFYYISVCFFFCFLFMFMLSVYLLFFFHIFCCCCCCFCNRELYTYYALLYWYVVGSIVEDYGDEEKRKTYINNVLLQCTQFMREQSIYNVHHAHAPPITRPYICKRTICMLVCSFSYCIHKCCAISRCPRVQALLYTLLYSVYWLANHSNTATT